MPVLKAGNRVLWDASGRYFPVEVVNGERWAAAVGVCWCGKVRYGTWSLMGTGALSMVLGRRAVLAPRTAERLPDSAKTTF